MPQFIIASRVKFIGSAIALTMAGTSGLAACTEKAVDADSDAAALAENGRQVAENAAKRAAQDAVVDATAIDPAHSRAPVADDLVRSVEDGRTKPPKSHRNESVDLGGQ